MQNYRDIARKAAQTDRKTAFQMVVDDADLDAVEELALELAADAELADSPAEAVRRADEGMSEVMRRLRTRVRERIPDYLKPEWFLRFFGSRQYEYEWRTGKSNMSWEKTLQMYEWLRAHNIPVLLYELRPDLWARSDRGPSLAFRILTEVKDAGT